MPRTTPPPKSPPIAVEIVPEQKPIEVIPVARPQGDTVAKADNLTMAPNTTDAQDKVTEGQRRINLLWENTQSRIALLVVIAGVIINSVVIISLIFITREITVNSLALMSICLQFINLTTGIVIGFYFSRTNHSATGGIGPKEMGPYLGR